MEAKSLWKWYTRIVGVVFVFMLVFLINEVMNNGNTPSLWIMAFHVLLGSFVLHFGWDNENFWKPFCLANGAFFFYIALFGWVFPNFAGLSAFGTLGNIFSSSVGAIGIAAGFWNDGSAAR